ncbi:MAG: NAD(P)/FAD-dependent oxidoreductase, partial [Candidatus Helarchaeales archaeon]
MMNDEKQKKKDENDIRDVIIIGGGPAGCSAAIYTARADLSTLVIDKNPSAGALGSTSKIENYPGIPGPISGLEVLNIMKKQAESFGAIFVQEQVFGVDFSKEIKEVFTPDNSYKGRTVIIATGSMGRKASIKGEEKLI